MYHEVTHARRTLRRRVALCAIGVVAVLALACAVGAAGARRASLEQGAASTREAVLRSAAQCCAVEGSYPSTISYLEDHYGLTVNHADYAITYEAFASNVMPSVVVVPK